MNALIQLKRTPLLIFISLLLSCFAFVPGAFAVNPPPDGGCPGFTTAEGSNASRPGSATQPLVGIRFLRTLP